MIPPAVNQYSPASNYWVLGLIGQGQFGQVYCAVHRKTGQFVALKHLRRDRLPTHRFLRELRFLLSLAHPHIVGCHTLEHTTTGRQLVLDYCEGGTLRDLMEQTVQMPLREILLLIVEVLSALDHAHSQGIVHCDIKPENILLHLTSQGWQARVSDFGIARLKQELGASHTGSTGSPAYMAPERFYHQYAEVSDLYAVTIILYELVVGDRPFSGNHAQLMVAHLNQVVTIPESLPKALQSFLRKGLEKLMARRFQTALEMKTAIVSLHHALSAEQLAAPFPTRWTEPPPSLFTPQQRVALAQVCHQLVLSADPVSCSPSVVTAAATDLWYWPLRDTGALCQPSPSQHWCLKAPIKQLVNSPIGAIALADKTLYALPPGHPAKTLAVYPDAVSVAPGNSRWIITQSTAIPQKFWLIDSLGILPKAPRPFEISAPAGVLHSLLLDDRHLLIADVTLHSTGLQIISRWGKPLGQVPLNTPLYQLSNSREPYQFLAQSGPHKQDVLVIKLKPFRVMRCRMNITPHWFGELIIGFVAVSATGQLQVANFQGQLIGQVDHLPAPTAIAFAYPHHIWLATNQDGEAHLHHIDVRNLELDIVF